MKSYKDVVNELAEDPSLRRLSEKEEARLREVFIDAYKDLAACCERNGLIVMLIGGSALGAVRHKGFIPWDDDFDVAMTRDDFETLKHVFANELGDKYILSSPNYIGNARNRFPMMLVKGTKFVEPGVDPADGLAMIKLDIFVIENVPSNFFARMAKGLRCSVLMLLASLESSYESDNEAAREFMCKTSRGRRSYKRRLALGRILSFRTQQQWFDAVDTALRYSKRTRLMGIPSGRGHYFGEIRNGSTFVPASEGEFEGLMVKLPGNPEDYLRNLYGDDFMKLPPANKRERHPFLVVEFNGID